MENKYMKRHYSIALVLTILVLCSYLGFTGCCQVESSSSGSTPPGSYPGPTSVASPQNTSLSVGSPIDSKEVNIVGCWSSGTGAILRITHGSFELSYNKYKPVAYERLKETIGPGGISLQLQKRPQFYYFQEFLKVTPKEDTELGEKQILIEDFTSLEKAVQNDSTGFSGWVESDCSKLFPNK